jgi:nucleotide-binding universal stress UspA family protein
LATRSRIQNYDRERSERIIAAGELAGLVVGTVAGGLLGRAAARRVIASRSEEPIPEDIRVDLGRAAWWVLGVFASWVAKRIFDGAWDKAKDIAQQTLQEAAARAQDAGSDPNPPEPTDAGVPGVPGGTSEPPDEGADDGRDEGADDGGDGDTDRDPGEPKKDLPGVPSDIR